MSDILHASIREAQSLGEWQFKPGQRVYIRVRGGWTDDWRGVELFVVGMMIRDGRCRVHVVENAPRDGGMDDVDPSDLVPA